MGTCPRPLNTLAWSKRRLCPDVSTCSALAGLPAATGQVPRQPTSACVCPDTADGLSQDRNGPSTGAQCRPPAQPRLAAQPGERLEREASLRLVHPWSTPARGQRPDLERLEMSEVTVKMIGVR